MLLAIPNIFETSLQLMDHDYEKFFLYWQNIASAIKVMKGHQQNVFLLFHTLQALHNLTLEFSFWSWSPSTYK